MNKLLRWKRTTSGELSLQVLQDDIWVNYLQATHKQPDYQMPGIKMSKGFATAQKYLTLGYEYISSQKEFVMSYIELLNEFLENKISVDKFQENFLTKFKEEDSFKSDEEYKLLDILFGDVDSYCDEKSDLFHPDFDLTEAELRESVSQTVKKLLKLEENYSDE